jgi:hypothetical protein
METLQEGRDLVLETQKTGFWLAKSSQILKNIST